MSTVLASNGSPVKKHDVLFRLKGSWMFVLLIVSLLGVNIYVVIAGLWKDADVVQDFICGVCIIS